MTDGAADEGAGVIDEARRALHDDHPAADHYFDRVFPQPLRFRSGVHWTPLEVARRAVVLLAPDDGARVLDIGAGVGKLCLVGALLRPGARWSGIERDAVAARAARRAAKLLGATTAQFAIGDIADVDWSAHTAFYLYNPFAELHFPKPTIDRAIAALDALPAGTRVVTYHGGFGPDRELAHYTLVAREPARDDALCLWLRD